MQKIGRNDPCSCGSGKKYKQCCMEQPAPEKRQHTLQAQIAEGISIAQAHLRAGRLASAETIYRQILQVAPHHPDALHDMGLIAYHAGHHSAATDLIGKAIDAKPSGAMYCNLGNALQAQGKLDAAIHSYRQALSLAPQESEAHYNIGNVLQKQGKLEAAVDSYRKALTLSPHDPEALYNLGNALQTLGLADDAIDCYRRALTLRPDYVRAHNNLGNAFKSQGKFDAAITSYRQALSIQPGYIDAHINLGNAFKAKRELDSAIDSYRTALSIAPYHADIHNFLGNTLLLGGKLEAAIEHYEKAVSIQPDHVEAQLNLGNALLAQNRTDAAAACFHRALGLRPDHVNAHVNLGNAQRLQGNPVEAIESYRNALSLAADCVEAHTGLAEVYIDSGHFESAHIALKNVLQLRPEHPFSWASLVKLRKMTLKDRDWLTTAQKLISQGGLTSNDEINLQFAAGKFYDDTEQYDRAFEAYRQARSLKKAVEGRFDRQAFSHLIDRLIDTFDAQFIAQRREGASASSLPVFVVGMLRSGTSLIEQIIASHPDAFGAGELVFWAARAEAGDTAVSGNFETDLISTLAVEYERHLRQFSGTASRIVDKLPHNFLWLGLILASFPNAKIIHARRNPADTCLSIYSQNLSSYHSYANDLGDLAFYYSEYARLMRHWNAVLPQERFLEMYYEDLIDDQVGWSRRIIEFIGLNWNDRCLNFHETERQVGTASNWQVRQKIYRTSQARWRHYENHLGPLLQLLDQAD